jgi:L-ascorbate metabolism protein UlaG (beta-lactamase superfamily)
MDITYLGHSSFKIKTKTATIITDPFDSEMVGLKFGANEAEIVTISHAHHDHNATDKISGIKKIVEGPGEYEISGISIIGFSSFHDSKKGVERGKNTIFVFEAEGLRLVHLGDLGHPLDDELINEIGEVDVLMVPAGGVFTIGPKEAFEIASKIDPYYILPMHFKDPEMKGDEFASLEPKETFLKETGMTTENLPKLTIKREDITEDQSTKVVVLERKS